MSGININANIDILERYPSPVSTFWKLLLGQKPIMETVDRWTISSGRDLPATFSECGWKRADRGVSSFLCGGAIT